jgi:hypothetical protein
MRGWRARGRSARAIQHGFTCVMSSRVPPGASLPITVEGAFVGARGPLTARSSMGTNSSSSSLVSSVSTMPTTVRFVVDEQRLADEVRPRVEVAPPAARSDHHSVRSARVILGKHAARDGRAAERGEEVRRHGNRVDRLREIEPDGAGVRSALRRQGREGRHRHAPLLELVDPDGVRVAACRRIARPDGQQAMRFRYGSGRHRRPRR